jgi:c-di-GMP-binding flagellar brake protein YcgR
MDDTRKGKFREVPAAELEQKLGAGERRDDPRVPANLEVELPLDWEQLRYVYTSNISHGGLMFSIESPVRLPAAIALTLTLPDEQRVALRAEVRHVGRIEGTSEFEVGVQFKELDPAAQAALERAVGGLRQG